MIEFERGDLDAMKTYCVALLDLGEKLRDGSELPFARAIAAVCRYARSDDATDLAPALDQLRTADAKHRLAYTLTRSALLDLERGRIDLAVARAKEALGYAEVLQRMSEIMLAHVVLWRACRAIDDAEGCHRWATSLERLDATSAAKWARNRALELRPTPTRVP